MTDTAEDKAREIAHEFVHKQGCIPGHHARRCNLLTAAILAYGEGVRAEEREACAKVADRLSTTEGSRSDMNVGIAISAIIVADAIRNRETTP